MSHSDPTLSFLSSPEIFVSGLVYFLAGVILHTTLSSCSSPLKTLSEEKHKTTTKNNTRTKDPIRSNTATKRQNVETTNTPAPPDNVSEPLPPSIPTPLPVDGYRTAVFVGPDMDVPKPWRITVVLHGNYDRPEWQCETWKQVAGFYGFILCPRGIPTYWAPKSEDRWMYRGAEKTSSEINAGISALKSAFPGQISDDGMILVGFSLGAILSPGILRLNPQKFKTLFLIEGLVDKLDKRTLRNIKKTGINRIGLAMSTGKYRIAAKKIVRWNEKLGIQSVFVNMAGAGHNYHPDFPTMGRKALMQLLQQP